MPCQFLVVVGSLRRESLNRRLAEGIVALPAATGHRFEFAAIGDLPLYDQDDDDDQAAPVKRLKQQIEAADAVIFVTPEYNRSIPGVLKNAIDHASRPHGKSAWRGKPAGIVGLSPSPVGTAMAQAHLRGVLAALDMPTLPQPEIYVSMGHEPFDGDGLSDKTGELLGKWLATFIGFARRQRQEPVHPAGVE